LGLTLRGREQKVIGARFVMPSSIGLEYDRPDDGVSQPCPLPDALNHIDDALVLRFCFPAFATVFQRLL